MVGKPKTDHNGLTCPPCFNLLSHQVAVALYSIDSNRDAIDKGERKSMPLRNSELCPTISRLTSIDQRFSRSGAKKQTSRLRKLKSCGLQKPREHSCRSNSTAS
jgi:hypothetical protein